MPNPSLVQQHIDHALSRQELVFGKRYDALVAQFHQAQADFHKLRAQCLHSRREWERLRTVVAAKQAAITTLLPFYPHPLTPALRYQIEVT